MKKKNNILLLPNGEEFVFLTREEVLEDHFHPHYAYYQFLYDVIDEITEILKIESPDISFVGNLQRDDQTPLEGTLFTKKESRTLNRPLIVIAMEMMSERHTDIHIVSVLAHELRHIYQEEHPDIFATESSAYGFEESLYDEREIDADGFALYYLREMYRLSPEQAAMYVCPEEKKHHKRAYRMRKGKAKEFRKIYRI